MDTRTLIIGASAAGLATAACLKSRGRDAVILERDRHVGGAWRRHYDRLHLHTPKSGSALPGLPMPREWPRYPAREDVVKYLEDYAVHHGLEPIFEQAVRRLHREDDRWVATTGGRTWTAERVVVATGATHTPRRPTWPGLGEFPGDTLHSSEYRNGDAWADKDVLVVGFGNSACEIALDLHERGARPGLAVRSAVNIVPRDLWGIPILSVGIVMSLLPPALADIAGAPLVALAIGDVRKLGLRKLPYGPNVQIRAHKRIPLLDIGTVGLIRDGNCRVHPGLDRLDGDTVRFVDGTAQRYDAIVLATGYVPALGWIDGVDTVLDEDGYPITSGIQSALPGLHFCGFTVSPSGMLREIGIEAHRIAAQLTVA